MKGFVKCSFDAKIVPYNGELSLQPMNSQELAEENNKMREAGFIPNPDLDCYIMENYGVFMGNVSTNVAFSEFYQEYIEEGYELVFGPPAPPIKRWLWSFL